MMSSGSKTDTADRTSEFGARNSEFGISSESRSADAAASREGVRPRHLVSHLRLLFAKLSLSSALGTPNSELIPHSEFRVPNSEWYIVLWYVRRLVHRTGLAGCTGVPIEPAA